MKTVRFLFNDEMARAIVDGRKTVTRRPCEVYDASLLFRVPHGVYRNTPDETSLCKVICSPGDLLIGRECWCELDREHYVDPALPRDAMRGAGAYSGKNGCGYRASTSEDGDEIRRHYGYKWRPSIHMPDWAARIRRRVVSATVERLQDITEDEAVREGFAAQVQPRLSGMPGLPGEGESCDCGDTDCPLSARMEFASAWIGIYAEKGLGWDASQWVWRIEFSAENVGATP